MLDEFWGDVEFYDGGAVWVIFDVAKDEIVVRFGGLLGLGSIH